jgi:hypothetical protein
LSKLVRVTGMLNNVNLAVNLKKKYGAAAIFVLYGNKNIPSAEILMKNLAWLRVKTLSSSVLMYSYVPNK